MGWVDERRRALVNLLVWRDRSVCALIDTGFNSYLLWEVVPSDLSAFEFSSLYEEVEVAGGRTMVRLGLTSIHWFDEKDRYTKIESFFALSNVRRGPGDPLVLIGTALLSGTLLVIDFVASIVRIERPQ